MILGVSVDQKEFCLYSYGVKQTAPATKKCFTKTPKDTLSIQRSEIVVESAQHISVISFANIEESKLSISSSQGAYYLEQCGILVVQEAKKSKIFGLNSTKAFDHIVNSDFLFDSAAFSCYEESGERFILALETSGASTLKVN